LRELGIWGKEDLVGNENGPWGLGWGRLRVCKKGQRSHNCQWQSNNVQGLRGGSFCSQGESHEQFEGDKVDKEKKKEKAGVKDLIAGKKVEGKLGIKKRIKSYVVYVVILKGGYGINGPRPKRDIKKVITHC